MENRTSKKLIVASKLIGYIGVGLCLVAGLIYFIFDKVNIKAFGPFKWENLYIIGGIAAGLALIAIVLRIIGGVKAKTVVKVEKTETDLEVLEDDLLESVEEEDDFTADDADAEETAAPADATPAKNNVCAALKGKLTPEVKEKIVATVKKNAPVIIAVAATATVSALISKMASDRKKAKIRRNLLDLLR